jgi:hypothetical protein
MSAVKFWMYAGMDGPTVCAEDQKWEGIAQDPFADRAHDHEEAAHPIVGSAGSEMSARAAFIEEEY